MKLSFRLQIIICLQSHFIHGYTLYKKDVIFARGLKDRIAIYAYKSLTCLSTKTLKHHCLQKCYLKE